MEKCWAKSILLLPLWSRMKYKNKFCTTLTCFPRQIRLDRAKTVFNLTKISFYDGVWKQIIYKSKLFVMNMFLQATNGDLWPLGDIGHISSVVYPFIGRELVPGDRLYIFRGIFVFTIYWLLYCIVIKHNIAPACCCQSGWEGGIFYFTGQVKFKNKIWFEK